MLEKVYFLVEKKSSTSNSPPENVIMAPLTRDSQKRNVPSSSLVQYLGLVEVLIHDLLDALRLVRKRPRVTDVIDTNPDAEE